MYGLGDSSEKHNSIINLMKQMQAWPLYLLLIGRWQQNYRDYFLVQLCLLLLLWDSLYLSYKIMLVNLENFTPFKNFMTKYDMGIITFFYFYKV